MSWLDLEGRGVVVVGAGGLGAACVRGFTRVGARVLVADRDSDRLARLQGGTQGSSVATLHLDVTEPDAGERVVAAALSHLGRLDVLVHAVGINDRRPVVDIPARDWERIITLNLSSAFGLCQSAGRHMLEHGGGRIVLLSSVSGRLAHRLHAPYAASKGGMDQMMRVMAAEWADQDVCVNAVAPGYVETELTRDYLDRPGVREKLERLVPAGRLGTPEEVVGPVLFLASPRAGFVTGHVLYVDGGRTLV